MHYAPLTLALLLVACGADAPTQIVRRPDVAVSARQVRDRHPEAAAELDRLAVALTAEPKDAAALARAAVLLADLGLVDEARAAFVLAREAAPDAAEVERTWGRFLLFGGDAEGALVALERAVHLAPTDAQALLDLAEAYALAGHESAERSTLERAWRVAPQHIEASYRLALAVEANEPERARRLLEEIVAADAWHLGAHANLARLLTAAADPSAERVTERHRELALLSDLVLLDHPESPERYLSEAHYYARHGWAERARAVLGEGLARHPGDAELPFLAGLLAESAGDTHSARDAFQRSLELRPGDPRVLEHLGRLEARSPTASDERE